MPAEREVIDLDEHNQRSTTTGSVVSDGLLTRRKMSVGLVAAFVAGGVLGGLGVSELRDAREERERRASVALVAVPVSIAGESSDVSGVLQMDGQLAVTNAGQAPVTVRTAAGQGPGAQVRDTGASQVLGPGDTGLIDVELRFECATAFESSILPMRFSVETDDRQVREIDYPVALVGSVWHARAEQPCARTSVG
ncbi:hypothetical protein ACIBQ2_08040 [Micromonospora sediminimaris]|uniref:Uncharacterized protein n=1 Tax=Micromonospora sediminimaris TaxID=547162 RepID=A0A9W5XKU8_9ACTN|nr:hypothetical protein [Micromonospora sediminimaris]GIJ34730.1 hypothetical protein Vse01_38780 [Micromonospora sediminimaris]SFB81206.1 hypothetical protein SAMN05216284_101184 [Micromonospora sediminimaris]